VWTQVVYLPLDLHLENICGDAMQTWIKVLIENLLKKYKKKAFPRIKQEIKWKTIAHFPGLLTKA